MKIFCTALPVAIALPRIVADASEVQDSRTVIPISIFESK
jgi:hypothetical protein